MRSLHTSIPVEWPSQDTPPLDNFYIRTPCHGNTPATSAESKQHRCSGHAPEAPQANPTESRSLETPSRVFFGNKYCPEVVCKKESPGVFGGDGGPPMLRPSAIVQRASSPRVRARVRARGDEKMRLDCVAAGPQITRNVIGGERILCSRGGQCPNGRCVIVSRVWWLSDGPKCFRMLRTSASPIL